jgi:membrane associated rhomboid family serine protease
MFSCGSELLWARHSAGQSNHVPCSAFVASAVQLLQSASSSTSFRVKYRLIDAGMQGGGNIGNAAHLGGALIGGLGFLAFRRRLW